VYPEGPTAVHDLSTPRVAPRQQRLIPAARATLKRLIPAARATPKRLIPATRATPNG
jgi:hypothetical protein